MFSRSTVIFTAILLGAGCIANSSAKYAKSAIGTRYNTSIALGTFDVKSGTPSATAEKDALDVDNTTDDTPEAKGSVKNSTDQPLDDIIIIIKNAEEGAGLPPEGAKAKIKNGGETTSGAFVSVPGGKWKVKLNMGGSGEAKPIAAGATGKLEIELNDTGSSPPDDFKVTVTGSYKNKPKGTGSSVHADVMGKYELDSVKVSRKIVLSEAWNDRIAGMVKNSDSSSSMTSMDLELSLPSGVTISSVTLQDPDDSYNTVSGSSATIDGSVVSVTGFTMTVGDQYELVVVFSEVPGGSIWMEVEGTYPN